MTTQRVTGFTLIELVMVIVLLGIVSGVLAPVITQNIKAYSDTKIRSELISKARIAIGRIERELRHAIPFSTNTTGTNQIEFTTSGSGGRYIMSSDPAIPQPTIDATDCDQTTERFAQNIALDALCVVTPEIVDPASFFDDHSYLVIGNSDHLSYTYASSGSWVKITTSPINVDSPLLPSPSSLWKLGFDTGTGQHTFPAASPYYHYQIADYTHLIEHDTTNNRLTWKRVNGIADPASATPHILIDNVADFHAVESTNGIISVLITVQDGAESVTITEDIYVRNSR